MATFFNNRTGRSCPYDIILLLYDKANDARQGCKVTLKDQLAFVQMS